MSEPEFEDNWVSTKEDGEISDDEVTLDEVISLSKMPHKKNTIISKSNSVTVSGSVRFENENKSNNKQQLEQPPRNPKQSDNTYMIIPTTNKKRRGQRKNKKHSSQPNHYFSVPSPLCITNPPNSNNSLSHKGKSNGQPYQQQYNVVHNKDIQQSPNPRFPWMRGKFSSKVATKNRNPSDDNYEDLLKQHRIIQEKIARLEEEENEPASQSPSSKTAEDDSTDVEITKVELPDTVTSIFTQNKGGKCVSITVGQKQTEKTEEQEDLDLMELRRLALASANKSAAASAAEKPSAIVSAEKTTTMQTNNPQRKNLINKSVSNTLLTPPSSSHFNAYKQREQSSSTEKPSPSDHRKNSKKPKRAKKVISSYNDRKRRSFEERENQYSFRRSKRSVSRSEERYRFETAEKRKRIEADSQKREIKKILTLDNLEEQCDQFLKLLKSHRKDSSKFDAFDMLTNKKINYGLPLNKKDKGNQDNYEEVEMDIDSNSNSPASVVMEYFRDAEYQSAMQPVPLMSLNLESYTTSQNDSQNMWLSGQQTLYPTPAVPFSMTSVISLPCEPPPPPPPPPEEPPQPVEEPRPPLPPMEDEDEETALLRLQLLQSVMEKRKSKEIQNKSVVKVTSLEGSSSGQSPVCHPPSAQTNHSECTAPQQPVKKPFQSIPTLPKHKPIVIRMNESSSDEENGEYDKVTSANHPSTQSLLGGLDDFLKQARKSVEVKTAGEKPKTMTDKVNEVVNYEKDISNQRELITKDQGVLKMLIGRANKYLGSLKTASRKIDSLREQLVAAEKIATANKQQLEQTKKQARQVKERLLERKDKLKETETVAIGLGCQVYGESYKPRLVTVESTTNKRKMANISITLNNDLAVKKLKTELSRSKENAPPKPASKKMSADRILQEKQRLKQLEKEFAEKIRLLKEDQAVKAVQTGSVLKPEKKPSKAKVPELPLDTIKLGGNDEVKDMCLPKPRRRSLAKLSSSNKPNITTPEKQKPLISKTTSLKPVSLKMPSGLQLSNLCKLQKEKVEKVLSNKRSVTWCVRRYSKKYPAIFSQLKEIKGLDIRKKNKGITVLTDDKFKTSNVNYTSPLLQFKSYRFSPYFRTKENKSVLSSTFANQINPNKILCRYDLQGKCNDDKCAGQHIRDTVLSEKAVMEDMVSNCPKLAGIADSTSVTEYQSYISKYVDSVINQHQSKMTFDEICILLISKINEAAGHAPPFTMFYEGRNWRPCQIDISCNIPTSFKPQLPTNTSHVSANRRMRELDDIIREEDVRYFVLEDSDVPDMESGVLDNPTDVPLWIKLAYKKLQDTDRGPQSSLDKALNVLARGIESNKTNSDIWYHYLLLYKRHPESHDLPDICQTAIQFSSSYQVWWLYLESTMPFSAKDSLCDKIVEYLLEEHSLLRDRRSHYLLEIVLYKVTLTVQTGRYKTGLNYLQGIVKAGKNEESHPVFSLLSISDKCVLWISFIHLLELHQPPTFLYSPNNQNPGKILDKDNVIIQWKSPDELLTSADLLIGYFWQALEQCSGGLNQTENNDNLLSCQIILDNFIKYLTIVSRLKDACEVCHKVLQHCPSAVDMWLTAANLYASCGEENLHSAQSVFDEAIKENHQSAKLFNHVANFDLLLGNHDKALEVLELFAMNLFEVNQDETPDPNVLYCYVLGQSPPFSTKLPSLKRAVSDSEISTQKLYLWLNYCLLLELQGDVKEAREMYETALSSTSKPTDLYSLWLSYIQFQIRQLDTNPKNLAENKQLLHMMTRSVVTMPTRFDIPWSEGESWVNYNLVNGLIDHYICCLPADDHMHFLEKYKDMMPDNMDLLMRTCEEALSGQEFHRACSLANTAIYDEVANVDFWKMIISARQKEGRLREVKKMYQKSVEVLPYSATLWKDFLLFEVTQEDEESVKKILKQCEEIGLNIQGFVATISS